MPRSVAGYVIVYDPITPGGYSKRSFLSHVYCGVADYTDDIDHAKFYPTSYEAESLRSVYPLINQRGFLPGKLLKVVRTITLTEEEWKVEPVESMVT